MATIHNEITINANVEKIWEVLANIEMLVKFDPTVKRSTSLSEYKSETVHAKHGKIWFVWDMLDAIMIRKQMESGIKKFITGLKSFTETNK